MGLHALGMATEAGLHAAQCRACTCLLPALQGGIFHGRILLPAEYPFKVLGLRDSAVLPGMYLRGTTSQPLAHSPLPTASTDPRPAFPCCTLQPPAFMMLTPNGRFETNMKICLSISSHHPEQWQPSWSVRTALTALVAFMPTPGQGALGALVSVGWGWAGCTGSGSVVGGCHVCT